MKGTSIWNAPWRKKDAVVQLLTHLGGSSRWKDLEKYRGQAPRPTLRKPSDLESRCYLRIGQTALKKVLDSLIVDGLVHKEARVGEHGPEVWYILTKKGETDIINSFIVDNRDKLTILRGILERMDPVEAKFLLEEFWKSLDITFVDDPHSCLPGGAVLAQSTMPLKRAHEEKGKTKDFYERTRGIVKMKDVLKGPKKRKPSSDMVGT